MAVVQRIAVEIVRNIGYILIDPYFLILSFLILYLYKRVRLKSEKTADKKQIRNSAIMDIIRGVIVGVLISSIFSAFEITIVLEGKLLVLLPIAMMLLWISPKWGCFSYVVPLTYFCYQLGEKLAWPVTALALTYEPFLGLIGILHMMEGILILTCGSEKPREEVYYVNGKLRRGQVLQKLWPVPLFIFQPIATAKWIFPIYGLLAYGDVCFYRTPKEKSRYTGCVLLLYGVMVVALEILVGKGHLPLSVAMLLMPIFHEGTFLLGKLYDRPST